MLGYAIRRVLETDHASPEEAVPSNSDEWLTVGSRGVRLGVVSDLHYTPGDSSALRYHNDFDVPLVLTRLGQACDWFESEQVDVFVLAGDLSDRGDSESLRTVLQGLASDWVHPALVVPGNHDLLLREDAISEALASLKDHRIAMPSLGGIMVGGLRVAGLQPGATPSSDAMQAWADEPVVMISHWPLLSRREAFTASGLRYPGDLPGHEEWTEALLARRAATVVVHGHLHGRDTHQEGSILQCSVGALVEAPFEATIVEISTDASGVEVRRRARSFGTGGVSNLPVLVPAEQTVRLAS
jgi:predicted phosphodiesterase